MGNCVINRVRDISNKQDKLIAGEGIRLNNNTISSTFRYSRVWENPDISVPFPVQTVQTGVTDAKAFVVTCLDRLGSTYTYQFLVTTNSVVIMSGVYYGTTNNAYLMARYVRANFNNGQISFGPGFPMVTYGAWGSTENTYMLPWTISAIR